ncbi:MAG TPA: ribonuclease P protein component, partial [Gemmatimonadota bacterium]|nr:ribonuclease P protein component [Gemmatimonadota bacterium]
MEDLSRPHVVRRRSARHRSPARARPAAPARVAVGAAIALLAAARPGLAGGAEARAPAPGPAA